jgi:YVTN family beta-propeller protein
MTGAMRLGVTFFAVLGVLAMPAASAQAAGVYHLSKTVSVGGTGGWDYLTVDDAARRVYVSHGTEVDVLDADSYKVVGKIENLQGVHGIALAPDLGHGFISDGHGDAVVVFDMKTLKTIAKVDTGKNPDAIVYEPVTHKVFAFNGGSDTATVIDTAGNKAVGTIDLGGSPEFAVADGKGHVFEDLEDKSTLIKIDAAKQTVTDRWPLAPGEEPSSLAIDSKNNRLFAGCHNSLLAVVNADTGKVVATLPIGKGVDAAVFDPQQGLAITSNGEGTLTVIHEDTPDKYSVVETVQTQQRSRTLALDKKTHRLFVPAAQFGAAPAPTPDHPHPRPAIVPGSFSVLVFDAAG